MLTYRNGAEGVESEPTFVRSMASETLWNSHLAQLTTPVIHRGLALMPSRRAAAELAIVRSAITAGPALFGVNSRPSTELGSLRLRA